MATIPFCLSVTSNICLTAEEISNLVKAMATAIGVPLALIAAYRSRLQRQSEIQLKRTEFTLAQHQRLFDDPMTSALLPLLDTNSRDLASEELFQAKKKFLTFFEELVLLINSNYIDKQVAYYMFGYYATMANRSEYFWNGISYDATYWGLFMQFATESEKYIIEISKNYPQVASGYRDYNSQKKLATHLSDTVRL